MFGSVFNGFRWLNAMEYHCVSAILSTVDNMVYLRCDISASNFRCIQTLDRTKQKVTLMQTVGSRLDPDSLVAVVAALQQSDQQAKKGNRHPSYYFKLCSCSARSTCAKTIRQRVALPTPVFSVQCSVFFSVQPDARLLQYVNAYIIHLYSVCAFLCVSA